MLGVSVDHRAVLVRFFSWVKGSRAPGRETEAEAGRAQRGLVACALKQLAFASWVSGRLTPESQPGAHWPGLRAGSGRGRGSFSFPPKWKQMFSFILETMQHVITQHNGVFVAERERLYPFPLV